MNITGFKYREPLIIITIIKCSHIREEEQKNNPQSKRQTSLWSANSQRLRLLFKLNREKLANSRFKNEKNTFVRTQSSRRNTTNNAHVFYKDSFEQQFEKNRVILKS